MGAERTRYACNFVPRDHRPSRARERNMGVRRPRLLRSTHVQLIVMAADELMVVAVGSYESATMCLSFNPKAPDNDVSLKQK